MSSVGIGGFNMVTENQVLCHNLQPIVVIFINRLTLNLLRPWMMKINSDSTRFLKSEQF